MHFACLVLKDGAPELTRKWVEMTDKYIDTYTNEWPGETVELDVRIKVYDCDNVNCDCEAVGCEKFLPEIWGGLIPGLTVKVVFKVYDDDEKLIDEETQIVTILDGVPTDVTFKGNGPYFETINHDDDINYLPSIWKKFIRFDVTATRE
jgi:hypothetical protein